MIELAGHLDILKDESTPEPIRNYGIELLEQLEAADIDSISTVEDLFGGNYFIIENKEDLKQVAFASTFSGRAPNGDSVNNLFYNCGVFSDTQLLRGDMDYIMFWESTNNAGGPTYFIPRTMWVDNVVTSFTMSLLDDVDPNDTETFDDATTDVEYVGSNEVD